MKNVCQYAKQILCLALVLTVAACEAPVAEEEISAAQAPVKVDGNEEWLQLFNGKNLDGWLAKFAGYPLGENLHNTFRVEDGVLKVSYENWDHFNGEFGHLFFDQVFSHYRVRVEYRFVGEQVDGGEAWAVRNNGIMFHSQDPRSMGLGQSFPVCIEAQMLGGNGVDERSTGNICTPGTHVSIDGQLRKEHCMNSTSPTFAGDQWVTFEVEVNGGESIRHIVNGQDVFDYSKPILDEADPDAKALLEGGEPLSLSRGYIAIQAETAPIEFRKIELLPLPGK